MLRELTLYSNSDQEWDQQDVISLYGEYLAGSRKHAQGTSQSVILESSPGYFAFFIFFSVFFKIHPLKLN